MKALILGLVVVGSVLASSRAQAQVGAFVCMAVYEPPTNTTFGNAGYVWASYTTAANCGGTTVAFVYYCSKGATNTTYCALPGTCVSNDTTYPEAALNSLVDRLQLAAINDERVSIDYCTSSGITKGIDVYFDAN